eukprot:5081017-Amphidinium_carterae.1
MAWLTAPGRRTSLDDCTSPDRAQEFRRGDNVYIMGLAQAFQYNGAEAVVQEKEENGRIIVRTVNGGQDVAVRPQNLKMSTEEPRRTLPT